MCFLFIVIHSIILHSSILINFIRFIIYYNWLFDF